MSETAQHKAIRRLGAVADCPEALRGGVVAIGNFDGLHRGHQAVLGKAHDIARADARPLLCLTFEPHPRTVFSPDAPVARITPAPMKARLLGLLGFDAVIEQNFTRAFAGIAPEAFETDILAGALGAAHVVAGFDFHYGARRSGTPASLVAAGARFGFGATLVPEFDDEGGTVISSSRIRTALRSGAVEAAAGLLGYRFTIRGQVVHGKKLGRTLGYPTANLVLEDELLAHGIYAVRFRRADGTLHDGVASYGRRPTFDDGAALFETFLFDFAGDLYGETVEVAVVSRLRGEVKFDSAEALVVQMDKDAAEARAMLADLSPLSPLDRALVF
ncbi:bifunctional riboflavin kinase/FAD synthetase [Fulvimarina sp. 2208YS6-2-32]|uniref:Riboflavin biosynthesis protein n=1 Tax=Fulvimarina uroteuthidis TaxID=3098149 RepID=A0ABU5I1R7_9HYPH|nr:bifunctional riboflavin kinase/FAD synthetase [Fulvimarina sp. 2208YS6-2-32]MDY8109321.1 bifunctional riboflavin kinase/FAD synthetase [Fulvimarina sp. 2208YS6-2-32]